MGTLAQVNPASAITHILGLEKQALMFHVLRFKWINSL
jgi:hypothetical protein